MTSELALSEADLLPAGASAAIHAAGACLHPDTVPDHWSDVSDQWIADHCTRCGSIINVRRFGPAHRESARCAACGQRTSVGFVHVPGTGRYDRCTEVPAVALHQDDAA